MTKFENDMVKVHPCLILQKEKWTIRFFIRKLKPRPRLKKQVEEFVDGLTIKEESQQQVHKPQFGSGKGMFVTQPDFDEQLKDFNK